MPLELQVVLREFTKTVLRERPSDVLEFSRDYFVEKAAQYRMCELRPRQVPPPAVRPLTAAANSSPTQPRMRSHRATPKRMTSCPLRSRSKYKPSSSGT